MNIEQLKATAEAYHQFVEDVEPWCREVAIGLDFDGAEDITLTPQNLEFVAYWYGSYQSSDHKHFVFEYADLLKVPQEVVTKLKLEKQQEVDRQKEIARQKQEEYDRQVYEKLHKKFGMKEV